MPRKRKGRDQVPLPTLRIYCEGEKTERSYLNQYMKLSATQSRKTVVSVEKTKKNTPIQLVEVAISTRESSNSLPEDEFWVVYDREATSKYPDKLHAKAMDLAKKNGVKVALSSICFEYWLLLHFVDTNAPYSCFDEVRKSSLLNDEVKKICGSDYEKSSQKLFPKIQNQIKFARERGARLNQNGRLSASPGKDNDYQINPYMGMVLLLDAIDSFI